jgi:Na+/H+-dicarboxylate symporter
MASAKKHRRRPSLSQAILLALGLGVACGLFFGEYCAPLQVVGDVFIGLLQMTVLPYIVLALMVNIGSLQVDKARSLAKWGVLAMLVLWAATVALIVILPLALPEWKSGSFFSTSLVEAPAEFDFLKLYVPVNPFESLAFNFVPAVVVFCIAVGVALIGAKDSERLLDPLAVALEALGRITKWVAQLTPIGVFALSASAAGTMTVSQFGRLQGYVILYISAALLLTFVVIPALVAAFTPFSMRDVVSLSKDAVLTALATDNVFIVLPLLTESAHKLFERYDLRSEESEHAVEVATPLAFPFPNAGRLLAMIFIPFAAWFVGRSIPAAAYPNLIVSGISSLFAKVTVALPFLLDLVQLPADLFNLFLLSGVVAGRFNSLAGAMHLFAFTLLVAAGVTGRVALQRRRAIGGGLLSASLIAATMFSTHLFLSGAVAKMEGEESVLAQMQPLGEPVEATVLDRPGANPVPLAEGQTSLDRIRERGRLRIGYSPENVPFTYANSAGDLVGFDVEMAHLLAHDLGVTLEFVPISSPKAFSEEAAADHFDIAMGGIIGTANRYAEMLFSEAYLEVTPALIVRDHERELFDTPAEADGPIDLGVIDEPFLLEYVGNALPQANIVPVPHPKSFFEGEVEGARVLLATAESGSAWTLLYPDFHVVTPWKGVPRWPVGYVIARRDLELRDYLDDWLHLKGLEGRVHEFYNHWILGRNAVPREPRWSVVRNVLKWVE